MSFQLQQNMSNPASIQTDGNTYTFNSPVQFDLQQDAHHTFDSGYTMIQIPPNCCLLIQPGNDLDDCSNSRKRYQQKDANSRISLPFHSRKKKHIRKGDKIFNMVLQNISETALQILPFVAKKKKNIL